jgi:hypothetical protein
MAFDGGLLGNRIGRRAQAEDQQSGEQRDRVAAGHAGHISDDLARLAA